MLAGTVSVDAVVEDVDGVEVLLEIADITHPIGRKTSKKTARIAVPNDVFFLGEFVM